jgi:galactokinase
MCCRDGSAMFLDTRTLGQEHVPLSLGELAIAVIDVGVERRLVGSGYAQRRAECEMAARQLGIAALRDATPTDIERLADDTLRRRARHVISENQRVLHAVAALRRDDFEALGDLLIASHASLRDDFEVSTPELDATVEAARRAGALGARLTGAGFGGCVIALLPSDAVEDLRDHLRVSGGARRPQLFDVAPVDGARRVA